MASDDKVTPAYIPFQTFERFVGGLKAAETVPPQIDRTVLTGMSGAMQGSLLSALRFLRLVNDGGAVLPVFEKLIEAHGTDRWSPLLKAIVGDVYASITNGLDVERGTTKMLRDAFVAVGVPEGAMLLKSTRFYVQALEAAGVKVSAYFKQRQKRSGGQPRKARKGSTAPVTPPEPVDDAPPEGFDEYRVPLPGRSAAGLIRFPRAITKEECALFEHAIGALKLYAQHNAGKGETPQ